MERGGLLQWEEYNIKKKMTNGDYYLDPLISLDQVVHNLFELVEHKALTNKIVVIFSV